MILLCALHLMDSLCVRLCVFNCVCLSVYVSERKAERLGFLKSVRQSKMHKENKKKARRGNVVKKNS